MNKLSVLSSRFRNLITGLLAHIGATPIQRDKAREYLTAIGVEDAQTIVFEPRPENDDTRLRRVK